MTIPRIFRTAFVIAFAISLVYLTAIGGAALRKKMYAQIERVEQGLREVTAFSPAD